MFELVNTTPGFDLSCTILSVCFALVATWMELHKTSHPRGMRHHGRHRHGGHHGRRRVRHRGRLPHRPV